MVSSKKGAYSRRPQSYNKFRNQPTIVDEIRFASKREARRYSELKVLERAKVIKDLQLQVRFPLKVNDQLICTYVADFVYTENGQQVIEDCKGVLTDVFKIKAKLMLAINNIKILLT